MKESPGHIRYLTREEIDIAKWDNCIRNAENGLIYARSFYLDAMAENWGALVLNDYEMVMPLPWKKKYGFSYLYQPAFTAQLGIFSIHSETIPVSQVEIFLAALPRRFRFAEIFLNYGNAYSQFSSRANFILDLNAPYARLSSRYKKDLMKNLKAAAGSCFQYKGDFDLRKVLALHKRLYQGRIPHMKDEMYARFETLCLFLQQQERILLRVVTDSQQEVLATALLPREKDRIYLLQSSVTPAGRAAEANHFLLDGLIRELAGQALILDFEGSEIPGIAHFYRNFGAENQPYFFYRFNRLPWPIRFLKQKRRNV
jgi:hypothetical protein